MPNSAPLRIGLAIPLQGPAGLFGPSCEAVAELAATQLNDTGVLGRPVEIEVIDAGAAPVEIARRTKTLIDQGRIHALTGWHISAVRETVAPVTMTRIPYVYTSLYEGGEHRAGVFCVGETPRNQVAPALTWLRDNLGLRRWCIVGDDYIWPRASVDATRRFAHELGLQIGEEIFVPYGTHDFSAVVERIAHLGVQGVLLYLVGQDAVEFNRAFARRGLQDSIVRYTPLMEENMLLASGAEATHGLFVSAAYFRSLVTASALDFIGDYVRLHGTDAPPLNNAAESCYEGIATLAALVRHSGCTNIRCLLDTRQTVGYEGPRGTVHLRNSHLQQQVHLAQADGLDFDIITTLR